LHELNVLVFHFDGYSAIKIGHTSVAHFLNDSNAHRTIFAINFVVDFVTSVGQVHALSERRMQLLLKTIHARSPVSVALVLLQLADGRVRFSAGVAGEQWLLGRGARLHVDTQEGSRGESILAQGTHTSSLARVELADVEVARQHDAARLSKTAPRTVGRQHVALQNFSGHARRPAVRTLGGQCLGRRDSNVGRGCNLILQWDEFRWLDGVRNLIFQRRLLLLRFLGTRCQAFPDALVLHEERVARCPPVAPAAELRL
jgi:hypothetical protein